MDLKTISTVCADIFDIPAPDLLPDTKLRELENWDSFGHIQFMIAIEEMAKVKFSTDEVQNVDTPGELMDLISRKLAGSHT